MQEKTAENAPEQDAVRQQSMTRKGRSPLPLPRRETKKEQEKKTKDSANKAVRKAANKTKQAIINGQVEQALLRKATGYVYVQQESYKLKQIEYEETTGKKKREWESVEVVEVEKHVPPEYSAIALWLKARMPDTWGEAAQAAVAEPVRIVDDIPAQTGLAAGAAAQMLSEKETQDRTKEKDIGRCCATQQ